MGNFPLKYITFSKKKTHLKKKFSLQSSLMKILILYTKDTKLCKLKIPMQCVILKKKLMNLCNNIMEELQS